LAAIDFYSCECRRDVKLARNLGYRGFAFASLPNSGGFNLQHVAALRSSDPPSKRKLLMIKGYDHFAGRAMIALDVLEKFADRLKGFQVLLFSPSERPWKRALEMKRRGVLDIDVLADTPHDQILSCFGRARLYMGISISDAISTSVLESMAMGAFPIQTDTSCCDEWFKDGEGGFIVPPDDFARICDRFERALSDDALVDRAAQINWETVKSRLDETVLSSQAVRLYETIFRRIRRRGVIRRLLRPFTA
jgi:glycosyltransferase involved in cell wall biosynthesis